MDFVTDFIVFAMFAESVCAMFFGAATLRQTVSPVATMICALMLAGFGAATFVFAGVLFFIS